MYEVPGKDKAIASIIDEDYQMIDKHLDNSLRAHIQSFEFIDFSKLLVKNRFMRDDKQRLEIINKNGLSYLSPISDSNTAINSYNKWEQAFRVYSNILTSKFPAKSPELLQYNHTIHTASMTYACKNVAVYDREFHTHIA